MKLCRTCNQRNEDSAKTCKYCKGVFFTRPIKEKFFSEDRDTVICSRCKKPVSRNLILCPICNTPVETLVKEYATKRYLRLRKKTGGSITLGDGEIVGLKMHGGNALFKGDPYVSDEHVRVVQKGIFFEIQDISEGNSFFLNNKMIAVGGSAIVDTGDVIKVGVTDLYVTVLK